MEKRVFWLICWRSWQEQLAWIMIMSHLQVHLLGCSSQLQTGDGRRWKIKGLFVFVETHNWKNSHRCEPSRKSSRQQKTQCFKRQVEPTSQYLASKFDSNFVIPHCMRVLTVFDRSIEFEKGSHLYQPKARSLAPADFTTAPPRARRLRGSHRQARRRADPTSLACLFYCLTCVFD